MHEHLARHSRKNSWLFTCLLMALVLYPFSIGPYVAVGAYFDLDYFPLFGASSRTESNYAGVFWSFYFPLGWVADKLGCEPLLGAYIEFWEELAK